MLGSNAQPGVHAASLSFKNMDCTSQPLLLPSPFPNKHQQGSKGCKEQTVAWKSEVQAGLILWGIPGQLRCLHLVCCTAARFIKEHNECLLLWSQKVFWLHKPCIQAIICSYFLTFLESQ